MYHLSHDFICLRTSQLGEEIMSYGASIYSHAYNPPITAEGPGGISRQQRRLPGTIKNSAPSRHEIEARLVMDRLLRECLTPKIAAGVCTAS